MSFDTPPITPRGETPALGDAPRPGSSSGSQGSSPGVAGGAGAQAAGASGPKPGFSLRGSADKGTDAPTISETIRTLVDKSIRKVELNKFTNRPEKYPGWRDMVETELVGSGVDDERI